MRLNRKVIQYQPIGIIYTPYKKPEGTPIQPSSSAAKGRVELFEEFQEGLKDLEGFSHLILLYHFHLAGGYSQRVKPFLDTESHGLFSTRAPSRPNPIGLSVVRLLGIEGATLHIQNVDIVNETPLLDIKPYVPLFDEHEEARIGWLEKNIGRADRMRDDGRFGRGGNARR